MNNKFTVIKKMNIKIICVNNAKIRKNKAKINKIKKIILIRISSLLYNADIKFRQLMIKKNQYYNHINVQKNVQKNDNVNMINYVISFVMKNVLPVQN